MSSDLFRSKVNRMTIDMLSPPNTSLSTFSYLYNSRRQLSYNGTGTVYERNGKGKKTILYIA